MKTFFSFSLLLSHIFCSAIESIEEDGPVLNSDASDTTSTSTVPLSTYGPILGAARVGKLEIAKRLFKAAPKDYYAYKQVFYNCAQNGRVDFLEFLISSQASHYFRDAMPWAIILALKHLRHTVVRYVTVGIDEKERCDPRLYLDRCLNVARKLENLDYVKIFEDALMTVTPTGVHWESFNAIFSKIFKTKYDLLLPFYSLSHIMFLVNFKNYDYIKWIMNNRQNDFDLPWLLAKFAELGTFEMVLHMIESSELAEKLNAAQADASNAVLSGAAKASITGGHLEILKYLIEEAPDKVPLFTPNLNELLNAAYYAKQLEIYNYLAQRAGLPTKTSLSLVEGFLVWLNRLL